MQFKQLQHFEALYRLRSFVQAAQQHSVTQSALSRSLQKLEDQLGQRLFDRTTHCVEPTAAADGLIQSARDVIDATESGALSVFSDGATLVSLWLWERATRATLVDIATTARLSGASAAELRRGVSRRVYTAREGDSLPGLALRFLGSHTRWDEIRTLNDLEAGPLTPGDRLEIPDGGR